MTGNQGAVWPHGRKCAVIITVLFDDGMDAVARAPDLINRSKSFSVWEYGAKRGVDRLVDTFAKHSVRASWFVPAVVAQKHASAIRALASEGHEVEGRGRAFERFDALPDEDARLILTTSRDILHEIAGRTPRGFRLPYGNWPRDFDRVLTDANYSWSASLNGDDRPYIHRSGLVQIPVHIELEDRPYFQFNFTPAFPKGQSRLPSYEAVLHNWIAEFDAYRTFGLCYVLQVRPEMIGTPGRIFVLEQLLGHILQFDDVWVATADEVASWHEAQAQALGSTHPLSVFEAYQEEHHSDA
jgi:peptidoglycan/xylan/chitin deacetylase (PgdA/CDA1 family)